MENSYSKHIKKVVASFMVLAGILSLFLVVKVINEIREGRYIGPDRSDLHTITVTGEGEVFEIPDEARFTYTVREEATTVEEAQSTASEIQNQILGFLQEADIPDEKIKTVSYNVFPRYTLEDRAVPCSPEFCPPSSGQRKLIGYEVMHTSEVRVADAEGVGEIISRVGERGADQISGVFFSLSDETNVLREARQIAIEDAKEKAQNLASDLGVSLGPLVSFNESGNRPFFDRAFSVSEEGGLGGAEAPEITRGENRFTANVTLTYEIR